MIRLSWALIVVSGVLLLTGIMTGDRPWILATLAVAASALVPLVLGVRAGARAAPTRPDAELDGPDV